MYTALAPLVGALITFMNGGNSRFSGRTGILVASLVIHLVGLAAVSALLLIGREPRRPGRLPFYNYLGGVVGVGTVFSSALAFSRLGASLAVALALIGQTLFSIAADATGLLGRTRYPLSARRAPGIALAMAGATIMAGALRWDALAMLAALAAGACPGLSSILNSELGRRKGFLHSTRANYVTGLATTAALALAARPPLAGAASAVAASGPLLALGGGLMGVAVVSSMSLIYSRMAAFSATLLIFCGEALTGVAIDAAAEGRLDGRKLAGTLVLLAGFAVDAALSRGRARPSGGAGTESGEAAHD
jgi:transporter family-2 protein